MSGLYSPLRIFRWFVLMLARLPFMTGNQRFILIKWGGGGKNKEIIYRTGS